MPTFSKLFIAKTPRVQSWWINGTQRKGQHRTPSLQLVKRCTRSFSGSSSEIKMSERCSCPVPGVVAGLVGLVRFGGVKWG